MTNPAFRPLLVPLMFDADVDVARDAIRSAARLGAGDFLFVPPLVSLLRNRLLKGAAREVLAGRGEEAVPALIYFMKDRDEDPVGAAAHPGHAGPDTLRRRRSRRCSARSRSRTASSASRRCRRSSSCAAIRCCP